MQLAVMASLLTLVAVAQADEAPAQPATANIDFSATAYPPLVKKWGGVEHPQW
jgi:hypothetical protein